MDVSDAKKNILIMKKIITYSFISLTAIWITWLIFRDFPLILSHISKWSLTNSLWLTISISLGIISMIFQAWILQTLLFQNTGQIYHLTVLARHFYTGQIIRYIPGRFFGVLYQTHKMKKDISAYAIIRSNMELMLFSLIANTSIGALLIIAFNAPILLTIGLAIMCILFLLGYLKLNGFDLILRGLTPILPEKIKPVIEKSFSKACLSKKIILKITFTYLLSWLFYLLAWMILSKVFPAFNLRQIIQLCGVYTLSWAVGFISMLTPGGFGIREAIFIYFGQPILNNSELAFFSIFLRFWLMTIDIFMALLATTLLNPPDNKTRRFDQNGYNILDPHDFLGRKSEYITLLQSKAIDQHLPCGSRDQIAVDLGCGYGRLTKYIDKKGWHVIGIDPDESLIKIARKENPHLEFRCGGLPQLPVTENSINLLVMHNMIRVLHLMNKIALLDSFEKYMQSSSQIYVVDNIRKGNKNYLDEESLINLMLKKRFTLKKTIPLRSARNWTIWLIWAGLIPRNLFKKIAEKELHKMSRIKNRPSWQYHNILFIFERQS